MDNSETQSDKWYKFRGWFFDCNVWLFIVRKKVEKLCEWQRCVWFENECMLWDCGYLGGNLADLTLYWSSTWNHVKTLNYNYTLRPADIITISSHPELTVFLPNIECQLECCKSKLAMIMVQVCNSTDSRGEGMENMVTLKSLPTEWLLFVWAVWSKSK